MARYELTIPGTHVQMSAEDCASALILVVEAGFCVAQSESRAAGIRFWVCQYNRSAGEYQSVYCAGACEEDALDVFQILSAPSTMRRLFGAIIS